MKTAVPFIKIKWPLILWGLILGFLLTSSTWAYYHDYLFEHESRTINGTILARATQTGQGRHGPYVVYFFHYRYLVGDVTYDCTTKVQPDSWSRFNEATALPLRYLPDHPAENRIDTPAEARPGSDDLQMLYAVTILAVVYGSIAFAYLTLRNKLNRRLTREGIHCSGRVTDIRKKTAGFKTQIGRSYLVYSFLDNQGREVHGKSWLLTQKEKKSWRVGRSIHVYYDPAMPGRHTVILHPRSEHQ